MQAQWALSAQGPLASASPGFLPREGQGRMAAAVAQALQDRSTLVVEAGTGVGKTFAYLVPLLLSGCKALVSTATKSLQDQLFLRDLPRLKAALGVPLKLALLKGRGSYLCPHRLDQARQSAELPDRFALRTLARVETWAIATRTGDLAEIDGLDDRSPVIPLVTSTRDNCLGSECPRLTECHVLRARRDALAADVVVINHHLFFADLALRDSGVAELLPAVEAVVFDEAHQLTDAGLQFLGQQLAVAACLDLARDVLASGLQHARGLQPWAECCGTFEAAARALRLACAGELHELRGVVKLRWKERAEAPELLTALDQLVAGAERLSQAVVAVEGTAPDFTRLAERLAAVCSQARRFAAETPDGRVRWIDVSAHSARLVESPLDIREMLSEQRRHAEKAWVFTSATLGDDEALSWFVQSAGLEDAVALRVGSPFDYARQARLWVPTRFPKPNEAGHPLAVGQLAARCASALNGRCFVLTTTLRVLPLIAQAMGEALRATGSRIELLVQGTQPRRSLMQQFGDGVGKVLLGSQSFWEGIDVPGDALQCVLIDKLPFPPPNDPLIEARGRQITLAGGNAFEQQFVSEAAISLKQGGGRLIRTEADRGLLVVCDPRLRQMGYGRRLTAALPPMTAVDSEADALAWLAELSAAHRR
ncbi:MAG: ATP-dependent DNA helicase [Rubrivivax sp.]